VQAVNRISQAGETSTKIVNIVTAIAFHSPVSIPMKARKIGKRALAAPEKIGNNVVLAI